MKKWINGCPNQWINVLSQQTLMGWIQACSSLWVNDESSKEWVVPADGWHAQISELFWPGYVCFHVHYAPKSRVHWILFPFHRWEAPGSWGTWLAQSFPWNYTAENKLWITDSLFQQIVSSLRAETGSDSFLYPQTHHWVHPVGLWWGGWKDKWTEW